MYVRTYMLTDCTFVRFVIRTCVRKREDCIGTREEEATEADVEHVRM